MSIILDNVRSQKKIGENMGAKTSHPVYAFSFLFLPFLSMNHDIETLPSFLPERTYAVRSELFLYCIT